MTKEFFLEATEVSPVIPAANSEERLEEALKSESQLFSFLGIYKTSPLMYCCTCSITSSGKTSFAFI